MADAAAGSESRLTAGWVAVGVPGVGARDAGLEEGSVEVVEDGL